MWINQIQSFLDDLDKKNIITDLHNKDIFDISFFFSQLKIQHYSPQNLMNLERIAKKIEVSKKIFKFYDEKNFSPIGQLEIDPFFIDVIFCHYFAAFLYTNDYKLLNTLLKLSSNTLSPKLQISLDLQILFEKFFQNAL